MSILSFIYRKCLLPADNRRMAAKASGQDFSSDSPIDSAVQ